MKNFMLIIALALISFAAMVQAPVRMTALRMFWTPRPSEVRLFQNVFIMTLPLQETAWLLWGSAGISSILMIGESTGIKLLFRLVRT